MRAYRVLLLLLPAWFREEFASEMCTVFREEYRAACGGSVFDGAALWLRTIRDVAALAWRLHRESLAQDIGYALRTLKKTPAFTLAAIGTLALGLGPMLVIANFLYQVVIAPLPFPDPDRIVRVWNGCPDRSQSRNPLSVPDYLDFRARQRAFDAIAAHTGTSVAMMVGGTPRQVSGVLTSAELHRVLGVHAVVGRDLMDADTAPGAPAVIVLGPSLWRSEFGGRGDVVGQQVHVDGQPTTIVGVLPEGLDFPLGSANAWVPLTLNPANPNRGSHFLNVTARMKPGVSIAQAHETLDAIARGLAQAYPDTNSGQLTELISLKEEFNRDSPRLLAVLSGAILAVLLVACLNVASLLTVRASVRHVELSVRSALGATGRRLQRQLMVEHMTLAFAGGVLGAALGLILHRAVIQRRLLALPRTADDFGWPALIALFVLIAAIGAAFARLAAYRSTRAMPAASLIGVARQTSARSLMRLREVLVVGEVAAALVLLVVAGLMLQSAARLAAVDPGFRTEGVLTFGVVLPMAPYREASDRVRFANAVTERLRSLPGVRQAAMGAYAPMGDMRATRRYAVDDKPLPLPGREPIAVDLPAGAGYFEVMGIPLLAGRTFTERDAADAPPVMIVSEQFARTAFPGEHPIGRRIRFYSGRPGGTPPPTREIVGVVADVRQRGVQAKPIPQMYSPYAQTAWSFASFFVLVDGDPRALTRAVERVVAEVDPQRPARDIQTTSAIVRGSTDRQRAMTWMLLALAALALILATVGLYGVSATAASARSRELAIRAAIGAEPGSLLRLVLRQGVVTAAVGIVLGAAASFAATRGLETLLYEVPARDPKTVVLTSLCF
jgi:putative ABC transport system permease protein